LRAGPVPVTKPVARLKTEAHEALERGDLARAEALLAEVTATTPAQTAA
jgi:hypothetical protein